MIESLLEGALLFLEHLIAVPRFIISRRYRNEKLALWRSWRANKLGPLYIFLDAAFHLTIFAGGCILAAALATWLL